MKKILLFGPKTVSNKNVYGGGVGGYTTSMNYYLKTFNYGDFSIIPCFHSVRGEDKLYFLTPFYRMLKDIRSLLQGIRKNKPYAVHILAQYRDAAIRDFFVVLIVKAFGLKVIYDIKAGAFISSYQTRGLFYKKMIAHIIRKTDLVLCEGRVYIDFIAAHFNKRSYYFPNFILSEDIPAYKMKFQEGAPLKVLFVGYAYKDKGVFELLDAISIAHREFPVEFTLIGEEHADFTAYLDKVLKVHPHLVVNRLGVRPHDQVLSAMASHNVYVYPTSHRGEGHTNSINEAMMNSLCIITTHNGFLSDVLGKGLAHYLDKVTPEEIYHALKNIKKDFAGANTMSRNAYDKVKKEYSSNPVMGRLLTHYQNL